MPSGHTIETRAGIVYTVGGGPVLRGDLYRPEKGGPHPIIVAVPGGGWRVSNPAGLAHWARHLAAAGFAVFAVEYRTSVAGPSYPGAVCDVLTALRFVCGEARAFDIDPGRLGIIAASAGAHLAALATFGGGEPELRSACPTDFRTANWPEPRALVLAYGVYDLTRHWHDTHVPGAPSDDLVERFVGRTLPEAPELYRRASPQLHLRAGLAGPATLLTWGTADRVVNPAQSLAFAAALDNSGLPVVRLPVEGAGHHWFSQQPLDYPASFTACIASVVTAFLATNVAGRNR
jgi:acetyl esterase/lipase